MEIITSRKELKNWIKYEKKKYGIKKIDYIIKIKENFILFRLQKRLRKTEFYFNCHKRIRYVVSMYQLKKMENKYSIHISINTCGKGLKIMHLGPVLINGNAKIGTDCTFHINTSVVAGGTNDYAPIIGNHVIFGVGSVALGKITISDYVAIGANSVVNKDVLEENIAVAGVPAKKISDNGAKSWNANKRNDM